MGVSGLVAVCVLGLASRASAATDTVLNTNDSGSGSLRAVIAAAEAGDTIQFAPGVTGTISLTTGAIPINTPLSIVGPSGSPLTIDANHASQIFVIGDSANVSISSLTFAHGAASTAVGGDGGAIETSSGTSLTVMNSTFTGNTAGGAGGAGDQSGFGNGGAIDNRGTSLTVTNSTFTANTAGGAGGSGDESGGGGGGAIDNGGTALTVTNSTFTANTAGGAGGGGDQSGVGGGGAIDNGGTALTVTNSTFTANTAGGSGGGGGLSGIGTGGAIDNGGTALTVTNSTFTANTAGGSGGSAGQSGIGEGGAIFSASGSLVSDTIDANSVGAAAGSFGSGVGDASGLTARSTIVSGNTGAANCDAPVASSDHSLEGPAGSTSCGFDLTSADPLLGPLANNGGYTETQALASGSPAVDVVPSASCPTSTDQRGFPRPDLAEGLCDVGAYEFQDPDADLALANVPANMTVNATGPQGAVVSYTPPTATDEGGETPTVGCLPASGSTFPIGITTVTCTATDADDTNSPVHAQFTVTVKSGPAQLQALLTYVGTLPASTARTVLQVQLQDAITASGNGNTARACMDLSGVIRTARQEQSYGQLTNAQATQVITAANQIATVTGCSQTPSLHPARASARHTHARRRRPTAT